MHSPAKISSAYDPHSHRSGKWTTQCRMVFSYLLCTPSMALESEEGGKCRKKEREEERLRGRVKKQKGGRVGARRERERKKEGKNREERTGWLERR